VKIVLAIAALVDLALALLLVAVSGFVFGDGPESMHAGAGLAAGYILAILVCIAAPAAGFMLNAGGRRKLALALALMPPLGALIAFSLPPPY
jgi:hypothetical protein